MMVDVEKALKIAEASGDEFCTTLFRELYKKEFDENMKALNKESEAELTTQGSKAQRLMMYLVYGLIVTSIVSAVVGFVLSGWKFIEAPQFMFDGYIIIFAAYMKYMFQKLLQASQRASRYQRQLMAKEHEIKMHESFLVNLNGMFEPDTNEEHAE